MLLRPLMMNNKRGNGVKKKKENDTCVATYPGYPARVIRMTLYNLG
jgi:hypothetical protein